jgi:surface antigen
MRGRSLAAAAAVAVLIGACTGKEGPKQTVGALGGAAVGGLIGSQIGSGQGQLAATAVGVLLGALIGSEIGRSMDDVDRAKADKALDQATQAPVGETITWNNPDSGNSGTVTPVREGPTQSGEYCREFEQTVTIGGRTEQAHGTACRQPDGSWKIVQ